MKLHFVSFTMPRYNEGGWRNYLGHKRLNAGNWFKKRSNGKKQNRVMKWCAWSFV